MSDAKTGCFIGDMSEYREGEPSACSGGFHEMTFRWTRGGIAFVGKVVKTIVCEGHTEEFRALGNREAEGLVFVIESDRILDQPIGLEKES